MNAVGADVDADDADGGDLLIFAVKSMMMGYLLIGRLAGGDQCCKRGIGCQRVGFPATLCIFKNRE